MNPAILATVGLTLLLVLAGAALATLIARSGHRHEQQVFGLLAEFRLHGVQTALRERQALNEIDCNVEQVRRVDSPPAKEPKRS